MDKVKVYLDWLKKHYFWVLGTIVLIAGTTCWYLGTSEVQARYNNNLRQIQNTYTSLNALAGMQNANVRFIRGVEEEDKKIHDQAFNVTELAYQVQDKWLKWPDAVKDIGDQLANWNKNRAADAPNPPGDPTVPEIPFDLRVTYQNNVALPELTRIFEKVKIRRAVKGAKADNPNNPGAAPIAFEGIVDWDEGARQAFRDRYRMDQTPSTVKLRITQEDYWVLESLIDIILFVNRGATDHLNAKIRRIEKIDVAQWATLDMQQRPGAEIDLTPPGGQPDSGNASAADSGLVQVPGQKGIGGEELALNADDQLLEGRYVDGENKPVSAQALKSSPPFAEFRQLPVLMRIQMDQRELPVLLAACANSPDPKSETSDPKPLPIEVRQVLMYFEDVDTQAQAGMGSVGPMTGNKADRGPFDCTIELRGIVYLYNPPVEKKLGSGSATKPAQRAFGVPTVIGQ